MPNTPGKRGNPTSVCVPGWAHRRPPVERSSTLLAAKLWFPLPPWVQGGRGVQSIISRTFRKQPPTSTASVPAEGTALMGHGRVGRPTGVPHEHPNPPRWPHGVLPPQPEQCKKPKKKRGCPEISCRRSCALCVLYRKREVFFKKETKGED